jgi:DNA-binding Lrp family transcriptional regulator
MNVESQIVIYLKHHFEIAPKEITEALGVSKQMIHRALAKLVENGFIEKMGKAPKVYYRLKEQAVHRHEGAEKIGTDEAVFLEKHFNLFTETGNELNGVEAFMHWCTRHKLPLEKTINEYIQTRKKYLAYYRKNELIDGTGKLTDTKAFPRVYIDKMYYGDFYTIERFGKTRIGNLVHYAKQGQSKTLMEKICRLLKENIETLMIRNNIDAVGYIPPTIKRETQLMNYMKKAFNFSAPHINLKKVSGLIPIPQKALSKIEDRISNAKSSIVVDDKRVFRRVLLIDDAVGSGATINETAGKLKIKKTATEVIGFALVGSFKGFDVISEV